MRESARHGHVINSSASVNLDMSEILTAAIIKSVSHASPNLYNLLLLLFTSDYLLHSRPMATPLQPKTKTKRTFYALATWRTTRPAILPSSRPS